MRWHDLMFLHWAVPAESLRPFIPAGLELETFDGQAWLGVVPFRMTGVRPRFVPPLPGLSAFPELNVRTYVTRDGVPGVWFFSLDASNPLAVRGARRLFHLPYFDATMSCARVGEWIRYRSTRTHRDAPPAEFVASYRPVGDVYTAARGTLDHWLTERYCLYAADRRQRLYRCDIWHIPWPLQQGEVQIDRNTMADQLKIALPDAAPLLHFSRRQDVQVWRLRPV